MTAQILSKKNILGEIYVFLMFPHRTRLTLQKRCSQWQYPSRRHCSPNYPVEELDNYREKLKSLKLKQKVFKKTLISELTQTEPNRQFPEYEVSNAK